MQQAGYHHANMLASQLREDLNNQQTEMLAMVQELAFQDPPPPQENLAEVAPVQEAANGTIGANVQLQLLQILQAMQAAQATTGNQQQGQQGQQGGNGNRNRTNKRTEGRQKERMQHNTTTTTQNERRTQPKNGRKNEMQKEHKDRTT